MIISGTYFGSEAEYKAFDIKSKIGGNASEKIIVFKDWLGLVGHWAEEIGLRLGGGIPAPLYSKTLTFNGANLIPDDAIDKVFHYLDKVEKGTLVWFVIFDLAGGAVNDIAQDATAYAHRDALFYLQSYAIGLGSVSQKTKAFLTGINTTIKDGMPGSEDFGAYAGYVDPEIPNGPREYWRTNLPRLEKIKASVDPRDVFHNPQSVGTSGSAGILSKDSKPMVGKPVKRQSLLARMCDKS
jgi:hypothetical protein